MPTKRWTKRDRQEAFDALDGARLLAGRIVPTMLGGERQLAEIPPEHHAVMAARYLRVLVDNRLRYAASQRKTSLHYADLGQRVHCTETALRFAKLEAKSLMEAARYAQLAARLLEEGMPEPP